MIYFKQLNVVSQGTADKFPLFVRYVKKQDNCAAHYHDFVELCIILSGHGKHLLNEKNPAPIYPGDVLVIPRSTVHRFIDVSPDLSLQIQDAVQPMHNIVLQFRFQYNAVQVFSQQHL